MHPCYGIQWSLKVALPLGGAPATNNVLGRI